MNTTEIAKILREEIEIFGLQLKQTAKSLNGSIYLEFTEFKMGKLRIADHEERSKYGYRWQIRTDIREPVVRSNKGHKQFFFPPDRLKLAARVMGTYYLTILHRMEKEAESDYSNEEIPL